MMLQSVITFQKIEQVRQGNFARRLKRLCEIHLLSLMKRRARNILSLIFPLFNAMDVQDIRDWQRKIFFYTMYNFSLDLAEQN